MYLLFDLILNIKVQITTCGIEIGIENRVNSLALYVSSVFWYCDLPS